MTVFGRNELKLEKLKQELNVRVTTNLNEVLLDPDIGIIDLCLPSSLHCEIAVTALRYGKHVFCETPVCLTLEEAERMLEAERQLGKRVLVNRFIHFDPPYRYLRESCLNGRYGKLLSLTLKRETPPLWGDLGTHSLSANLMIHDLDFIADLPDSPAFADAWGTGYEDRRQALVRVIFKKDGTWAEAVASSGMPDGYPFTVGYEAYFESAKLVYVERDSEDRTGGTIVESTAAGDKHLVPGAADPYAGSLEAALQSIMDGSASLLSLAHAARALEIALEVRRRISGQPPLA